MIFAVTIFVSAFLLFLVQPLIGRVILPWFGGSAGVWTTCMMFFQALLVGGYAYSHLSIAKLRPRAQALLHLSLIGLACGLVLWRTGTWGSALIPDASLKPADSHDAPLRIALLLAATVGVPYFVLSTTGPLIQAWYGRLQAGDRAYRLYALSNVGSLLALVAYPFVLEPALAVRTQSLVWTVGFVGFALCCAAAALTVARRNPAVVEPAPAAPAAEAERVPVARWLLWLTLGAAPSFMMLATTTELCNEVAVVPFLWVAPLTLYLLSFILTFDSPKWYRQGRYLVGLAVASIWTSRLHDLGASGNYRAQILAYLLTLFAFCMVCHGELVRLKPGASRLTSFYLALSVGGAVGGLLGGLLAPTVFGTLSEFRIGLVAGWLLLGAVLLASRDSALNAGLYKARRAAFATVAFVLGLTAVVSEVESARGVVVATRGFFGTLRVYKEESPKGPRLSLYHGLTAHGGQYVAPELRSEVSGYYGSEQAVREAIEGHPRRLRGESIRVAVIGLGVGNLAALGRPGDLFRFYEIDPEVVRLAEGEGGHFSFLKDSPAQVEVVLGDGRISLERELASGAERFDVLVLDAFSGDAIPVHLLTREAFDIYLARLRDEESVITAHVSNRYFQLVPVVWEITRAMGLSARVVDGAAKDLCEECSATWMVVARDEAGLQRFGAMKGTSERLRELRKSLWTDDYASLFDVRQ